MKNIPLALIVALPVLFLVAVFMLVTLGFQNTPVFITFHPTVDLDRARAVAEEVGLGQSFYDEGEIFNETHVLLVQVKRWRAELARLKLKSYQEVQDVSLGIEIVPF